MSKGLSAGTFTGADRSALRRLVRPGWLVLHLVALVGFAGCVGLGRWQWQRAEELGRIQNYSYALEWWLFAAFAVFLWLKTMADTLEDAAAPDEEQASEPARPTAAPAPVVDDEDDPELAAYNRHLAALHEKHQAQQ